MTNASPGKVFLFNATPTLKARIVFSPSLTSVLNGFLTPLKCRAACLIIEHWGGGEDLQAAVIYSNVFRLNPENIPTASNETDL